MPSVEQGRISRWRAAIAAASARIALLVARRWPEIVVTYLVVAIGYNWTHTDSPWWLLALCAAVTATEAIRAEMGSADWRSTHRLVSLLWFLTGPRLVVFAGGTAFFAVGVLGLWRGSVTLRGRVGPSRTYVGRAAVFPSIQCVLLGSVGMALVLVGWIPVNFPWPEGHDSSESAVGFGGEGEVPGGKFPNGVR